MDDLDIHPHMLRHSTGYAMVNNGNDFRIIQEYLGHKAISSTVRYTKQQELIQGNQRIGMTSGLDTRALEQLLRNVDAL
jgi:integrase